MVVVTVLANNNNNSNNNNSSSNNRTRRGNRSVIVVLVRSTTSHLTSPLITLLLLTHTTGSTTPPYTPVCAILNTAPTTNWLAGRSLAGWDHTESARKCRGREGVGKEARKINLYILVTLAVMTVFVTLAVTCISWPRLEGSQEN